MYKKWRSAMQAQPQPLMPIKGAVLWNRVLLCILSVFNLTTTYEVLAANAVWANTRKAKTPPTRMQRHVTASGHWFCEMLISLTHPHTHRQTNEKVEKRISRMYVKWQSNELKRHLSTRNICKTVLNMSIALEHSAQ